MGGLLRKAASALSKEISTSPKTRCRLQYLVMTRSDLRVATPRTMMRFSLGIHICLYMHAHTFRHIHVVDM